MVKTGVFTGISNDVYHRGPEVSKSVLDRVRRSLFHYFALTISENRPSRTETRAQALGTATHAAILEPERFETEFALDPGVAIPEGCANAVEFLSMYAPAPRFDRRTTEGKKAAAEWQAANPEKKPFDEQSFDTVAGIFGKTVLGGEAMRDVRAMAASVRTHPVASKILASGIAESSVYWVDEKTGRACRCRPDWFDETRGIIADVKTTSDASPREFWRSVWNYRYYVQAAFYIEGIAAALRAMGREVPHLSFCIIAVESSYPYAVCVYDFDPDLLAEGAREFRVDLDCLVGAETRGEFTAWENKIHSLKLPEWKRKNVTIDALTVENPF